MHLYKAIKYNDNDPQELSSNISKLKELNYKNVLLSALIHVSHGNKKSDMWMSTTTDIKIAHKYLRESDYFNGIAIIDLPDTQVIGKPPSENFKCDSCGIIYSLDMSKLYTYYHIATYFWWTRNLKSISNIRTLNYACKSKEVLLLGKNIKYKFIPKEKIDYRIIDQELLNNKKFDDFNEQIFISAFNDFNKLESILMIENIYSNLLNNLDIDIEFFKQITGYDYPFYFTYLCSVYYCHYVICNNMSLKLDDLDDNVKNMGYNIQHIKDIVKMARKEPPNESNPYQLQRLKIFMSYFK